MVEEMKLEELKKEFNKISSVVADDTYFVAKAMMLIAYQLEEIKNSLTKRQKRKISEEHKQKLLLGLEKYWSKKIRNKVS